MWHYIVTTLSSYAHTDVRTIRQYYSLVTLLGIVTIRRLFRNADVTQLMRVYTLSLPYW